jgi:hypothetical protein
LFFVLYSFDTLIFSSAVWWLYGGAKDRIAAFRPANLALPLTKPVRSNEIFDATAAGDLVAVCRGARARILTYVRGAWARVTIDVCSWGVGTCHYEYSRQPNVRQVARLLAAGADPNALVAVEASSPSGMPRRVCAPAAALPRRCCG